MIALLLLQASLLARPLYLDAQPPELRSVRALVVLDSTSARAGGSGLSPEEALEFARRLRQRALAGEHFEELVRQHSNLPDGRRGGVLGSFAPGMLAAPIDRFLFGAEVGEISEPIVIEGGVQLLQRIETWAAVLVIGVDGTDEQALSRARELIEALRGGADFAEQAREHSSDRLSAERGGQYSIFERGPRDSLLKAAAFRIAVGELFGPLRTAQGFVILRRVSPAELDPELREQNFVRLRAILVSHVEAPVVPEGVVRDIEQALELAEELHARIQVGEDMAALATEFNDDPGGSERAGDLGWVHRRNPDLPRFLGPAFLAEPGTLLPVIRSSAGFVILRRER